MVVAAIIGSGCNNSSAPPAGAESKTDGAAAPRSAPKAAVDPPSGNSRRKFEPLRLGAEASATSADAAPEKASADERRSTGIISALQPFQVLLGKWRWITRKSFGDSPRTAEDLEWIWDLREGAKQPSLTGRSESNPYFRQLWLTWLPDEDQFQVTIESAEGDRRLLRGTWAERGEPKQESDGKKLQHTYKLQLVQFSPAEGENWQLTLTQLDNNQYLMDLARRPSTGSSFGPLDTVRQQRLGTSFAVADSDNPGPKCIISGGLGTMSVTYKGKSYPVCCSGCAAAFNDDPERWLARLAEREKKRSE